ncbi:MAG: hypothetical protein ACRCX2_37790 [Paraclostridium sp.]
MQVFEALKTLKDYCENTSVCDCNDRKCEIWNILGDCLFNVTPEEWKLEDEKERS